MKNTLRAAFAAALLCAGLGVSACATGSSGLGSNVLVAEGLRLPRTHQYELYNRDTSSYTGVAVDSVPGYVRQGAWVYDRTGGAWVAHPSVGAPNPQYAASGRDISRGGSVFERDVLVVDGLRLPRSHQYELYNRDTSSYGGVTVDAVPGYVRQGAWIYDRTASTWVSHPSVGSPNPQYGGSGRDGRRATWPFERDALVADGLRLPRSHQYEVFNRDSSSYAGVAVDAVPGHVRQGAWIYDRTAAVWVTHPSVGTPNPQYSDRR